MQILQKLQQATTTSWYTQSKMCEKSVGLEEKQHNKANKNKVKLTIFEMTLFAMFGSMMFISKIVMEFLPNMHLLGMFTILLTVVYRKKALIPIYIYVLINGIFAGFNMWWIPYTYIWTVLWGVTMLLPKNMSKTAQMIVYPLLCALHGLCFGLLYAPAQMVMFSFSFKQIVAWVIAGLPFDAIHAVSNLIAGLLIYPLSVLLKKLNTKIGKLN